MKKTFALYGSEKDWKIFLENVEKRRVKQGVKKIIVGHTHKYYLSSHIINAGTFIYDHTVDLGKYFIISDAHLGINTTARLKKILKLIRQANAKNKTVILLGDIFELWTEDPVSVVHANTPLIEEIITNPKIIYIRGNHDYDIEEYCPRIKGLVYNSYKTNDYYFYHGWEDDPLMKNIFARIWYYLWINIGDELYLFNEKMQNYLSEIIKLVKK